MTGQPVVYVLDDDELVRNSLSCLVRSVGLRAELFATPDEFLAFERSDAPSCLVLDVRLPGTSGLAFQQRVAKIGLRIPIIFMTAFGDVPMSVKAMKAGATDFLPKPFRDQDMLDAISVSLAQDRERILGEQSLAGLHASYASLTEREKEVVGYLLAGLMNKQIAKEVRLSEVTVKLYRARAMKKMGSRTVADLVLKTTLLGISPTRHAPLVPKVKRNVGSMAM
jgi:FixJ family two-component response regulator